MNGYDVLIVGAGHAGAQCAAMLRQRGFLGTIGLVGAEIHPPYERPPLSKEYLARAKSFDRILLRPVKFWSDRNIDLLLGHRVAAVDPSSKTVRSANGVDIGYGQLVWATGGRPRKIECPGHELAGIHYVRNRDHIDRLQAEIHYARNANIVIIGGGYIGLEAAAVLGAFGKRITLIEAQNRVLARVAAEPLSRFYEREHAAHGVELRLSSTVRCLAGSSGRIAEIELSCGERLPADIAIVGIGIIPSIEPLAVVGAEGSNGVKVDPFCRTNLPDIFAIGDCALHASSFADGAWFRVESVQNANDQATTVAKYLTGTKEPYASMPWFWSNQYDLKLQTAGLSVGYDDIVIRGIPEDRSFSLVYLKRGRVIALDCVNRAKDYVQGRALIARGAHVQRDLLADVDVALKDVLA